MQNLLTPFVLGSVIAGGVTALSFPVALGFLTSLRYPQPHRAARARQTGRQDHVSASGQPRHRQLELGGAVSRRRYGRRSVPGIHSNRWLSDLCLRRKEPPAGMSLMRGGVGLLEPIPDDNRTRLSHRH